MGGELRDLSLRGDGRAASADAAISPKKAKAKGNIYHKGPEGNEGLKRSFSLFFNIFPFFYDDLPLACLS